MLEKIKNIFSGGKKSHIKKTQEITAKDLIAPPSIEVEKDHIEIEGRLMKTFFIFSYPRYLSVGWISPIINLQRPVELSFFFKPKETPPVLKKLRKKTTSLKAELMERQEKGLVSDPSLETARQDIERLRQQLSQGQERMFDVGIYINIHAADKEGLRKAETEIRSTLESRLIYLKPAVFEQKQGLISCSPYGLDQLDVSTIMNTSPLSSIFPFTSFDLSAEEGIMYGVNQHNNSLILFDRFSLENANEVVFAKSGAGKSYFVKLELLRYLMQGVKGLIIDPENEYKFLVDAVGGSFFNISLSSPHHLNPFDLPTPRADEDPENVLRRQVINLVGLLRIMLGGLSPEEDAIIDQAITETYAIKDITPESDFSEIEPPLLSDLENVVRNMEGGQSLSRRLKKFTQGSYANFFNKHSNIDMDDNLVVFGTRNMEDDLRPTAMRMILQYIWNDVLSKMQKRILVIDEAWWIMQEEDGASFLFGLAKRGRKYWLGITTITQDVSDFMDSKYGPPIINNSSLQFLMKQSPASIGLVKNTFHLTSSEAQLLLSGEVGEGVFLAGKKRASIRVEASYVEDQIITTDPAELSKKIEDGQLQND